VDRKLVQRPGCFYQIYGSLEGVVGNGKTQTVQRIQIRFENPDRYVFQTQFFAGGYATKPADNGKFSCLFDHKGWVQHAIITDGYQQVINIRPGRDAKSVVCCIYLAQGD